MGNKSLVSENLCFQISSWMHVYSLGIQGAIDVCIKRVKVRYANV